MIHTIKGFSIVNETKVDVFLEFPWFFYDPTNVDNLISGSSAFSKSSLYIWKFFVHILLKPSLKNFEHNLTSMWNECNCMVVWTFFSIALLRDWNESWAFPVLWPLLSFPNLLAYWMQHFKSIILRKKKKRKYLLSIDCVPGTRLYVLHRRCCISSWSYCTYFVAEKIEA